MMRRYKKCLVASLWMRTWRKTLLLCNARSVRALLLMTFTVIATPAFFEEQSGAPADPPDTAQEQKEASFRSIRCRTVANPHKRYHECVGKPIDYLEETVAKDWAGLRKDMSNCLTVIN